MPEEGEDTPAPWAPLEAEPTPQAPPPPPYQQPQPPPPYQPPQPPMWPPPPGYAPAPGTMWPSPPPLPKAGDARTGPLPLHPMTMSDILDGAFKLFKANVRTVVLITAAFVVPLQLVAAFAQRNIFGGRGFGDLIS